MTEKKDKLSASEYRTKDLLRQFTDLELAQELCDRLGHELDEDDKIVIRTNFVEIPDEDE